MTRFTNRLMTTAFAALLSITAIGQAYAADSALLPAAAASGLLPRAETNLERLAQRSASPADGWKKQWAISLAPLLASQALDAASSYGMRELNPLLAGRDGSFGMKASGIKFGAVGGLIAVESLLVKKYPKSAKVFSIVNWTTTGITSGLAAHNFTLPR